MIDATPVVCAWCWALWMRERFKGRSLAAELVFGDLAIGLGWAIIEAQESAPSNQVANHS